MGRGEKPSPCLCQNSSFCAHIPTYPCCDHLLLDASSHWLLRGLLQREYFWGLFCPGFPRGSARSPERDLGRTQCAKLCLLRAGWKWDPEAPREPAAGSGSHSRDLPFPQSPRCASINDLLVAVLEPWETGGEFPCLLTSRNPLPAPLGSSHFFK